MRNALLCLMALMLMAAMVGCDKPDEPDNKTVYDKQLDGEAPQSLPPVDLGILNPGMTAGVAASPVGPTAETPVEGIPTAEASGPVAEVKAVLAAMDQAAVSGNVADLSNHLDAAAATSLTPLVSAMQKAVESMKKAEDAIRQKLGQEFLDKLNEESGTKPVTENWFSDLAVTEAGDAVNVADSGGNEFLVFTKTDDKWQGRLANPFSGGLFAILAAMMGPMAEGMDAIAEGVNSGAITAENFEQETNRIMSEKMPSAPPGVTATEELPPMRNPEEQTPPMHNPEEPAASDAQEQIPPMHNPEEQTPAEPSPEVQPAPGEPGSPDPGPVFDPNQ